MTPEEKKRVLHAWRTIGLVMSEHRDCLTRRQQLLLAMAHKDLAAVAQENAEPGEEWPTAFKDQWESLK